MASWCSWEQTPTKLSKAASRSDCAPTVFSSTSAANAHYKIAHVERQNAFLRAILEKLVDTFAATTVKDIELLIAPALHAANSLITKINPDLQASFHLWLQNPTAILKK